MRKTARDLKKREFEYFLKATVCDVMRLFGYSKLPYVFETKLPGYEMMSFITRRNGKYSAIAYDYQKIAATFSRYDKEDVIGHIVFITAHEMRHYYQHRQIRAKSPRENEKTVTAWKNADVIRLDCDYGEYFGNVRAGNRRVCVCLCLRRRQIRNIGYGRRRTEEVSDSDATICQKCVRIETSDIFGKV